MLLYLCNAMKMFSTNEREREREREGERERGSLPSTQRWMYSLTMRTSTRKDPSFPLCHENQSLLHVLNNCRAARDYRRYNIRHDSILSAITETVSRNIPQTTSMTADISDTYEFPHHIIPTDLRPDLVWWDDTHKSITLVELTVCFETNFEQAAQRKKAKYLHLVEQANASGYRSELITSLVGSSTFLDLRPL